MAGLDVNSVVSALGGAQQAQVTSLVSFDKLDNTFANLVDQRVQDAQQLGDAQSNLAASKLRVQQQQEQTNLSIANRFGMNPNDVGFKLNKISEDVNTAADEMRDASARIQDKQRVTLFDNPLKFLINQFTVNQDIADYNAAERKAQIGDVQGKMLSGLLDEGAKANIMTLQSITEADIADGKIAASASARREALAAQVDGMRWNRESIKEVASANKEIAGLEYQKYNAYNTELSRQLQERGLNISAAHLALSQQEHAQRMALKAKADADENFMADIVTRGIVAITGEVPDSQKVSMFKGPAKSTEQGRAFIQAGLASFQRDPSGQKLSISATPWDAAALVGQGLVKTNTSGTQPMGQVLQKVAQWRAKYESLAAKDINLPADKAQRALALEAGFNKFAQDQADLLVVDPVFAPAKFATVAAKSPSFQESKLWSQVLLPAQAAGVDVDKPGVAMPLVVNAIMKGQISTSDAQTLQQFYARGLELSNLTNNWQSIGMRGPTQMTVGNVDYADKTQFATALNKELRLAKVLAMPGGSRLAGFN